MAVLIQYPRFQAFDSDGKPLSGGKVYTYQGGTLTNKATFTNALMTAANTNPVILNSRGECVLYGSGSYKFKLTDADDVEVWTQDNINATP